MAASAMIDTTLPEEAKAVIWRISGEGEWPPNGPSAFDLIERIIRSYVTSSDQQDLAISSIRGWFEASGARMQVKPSVKELVATLILDGIGGDRSPTAVWAVGSIEGDLAMRLIRSLWSQEEVDSFIDAALSVLENVCHRDEVLDGTRVGPYAGDESHRAWIPRDAVRREGRLGTFRHLHDREFELVFRALHPSVRTLIGLILELEPERFSSLVERLDHPVMQARAAYVLDSTIRAVDHRHSLRWITESSCDELIALAIVHTLKTVNRLDEDVSTYDRLGADQCQWGTELHAPKHDLNAAALGLVNDLVGRLALLEPIACARWIGELLADAPYLLNRGSGSEKPLRIKQLEQGGTELLVRLVRQSWSDDLIASMFEGLRLTPRETWTRHVAEVAWEVRDAEPEQATTLALAILGEHERWMADELQRGHVYLNWNDWHDREWITGLGCALALSATHVDLLEWISTRCQALSLSVWDAEENYEAFSSADRAAQNLFLVALHAVSALKHLARTVDVSEVRSLVELVRDHCYFVALYLGKGGDDSIALEHAARSVVEFGEPSDRWVLEQARSPKVGPRALWALIDQRNKKIEREGREGEGIQLTFVDEITRSASSRFGDGGLYDFDSLLYWGRLWLLLGASEQALHTAKAILSFPARLIHRGVEMLVLELLAVGVDAQGLDQETKDYMVSRYRKLWPALGYAPETERKDRQRIDRLLEQLGIFTG